MIDQKRYNKHMKRQVSSEWFANVWPSRTATRVAYGLVFASRIPGILKEVCSNKEILCILIIGERGGPFAARKYTE